MTREGFLREEAIGEGSIHLGGDAPPLKNLSSGIQRLAKTLHQNSCHVKCLIPSLGLAVVF